MWGEILSVWWALSVASARGLLQSRLEQGACVKTKVKICFFMFLIIEGGWPLLLSPILYYSLVIVT